MPRHLQTQKMIIKNDQICPFQTYTRPLHLSTTSYHPDLVCFSHKSTHFYVATAVHIFSWSYSWEILPRQGACAQLSIIPRESWWILLGKPRAPVLAYHRHLVDVLLPHRVVLFIDSGFQLALTSFKSRRPTLSHYIGTRA